MTQEPAGSATLAEVLITPEPGARPARQADPAAENEALRMIARQLPEGRDALLVALTGWGQADDVRRCRDAGFDHHRVRPPAYDKLLRLLAGEWRGERVRRRPEPEPEWASETEAAD